MEDITDEVAVGAPIARVWRAIQDTDEHVAWHPYATRIEGEHALGGVRTCSVLLGGRPGTSRERCSTFDEANTIMWTVEQDSSGFLRMVTDWTTGFRLEPQGSDTTRVRAESLFRPRRLFVRVIMPVVRRRFHQTQRSILAGLKQYVEG